MRDMSMKMNMKTHKFIFCICVIMIFIRSYILIRKKLIYINGEYPITLINNFSSKHELIHLILTLIIFIINLLIYIKKRKK